MRRSRTVIALTAVGVLAIVLGCENIGGTGTGPPEIILTTGGRGVGPLTGGILVSQSGRDVVFSPWLKDAQGRPVRYVMQGRRLVSPKVQVYDSAGELVYTGTMEYG